MPDSRRSPKLGSDSANVLTACFFLGDSPANFDVVRVVFSFLLINDMRAGLRRGRLLGTGGWRFAPAVSVASSRRGLKHVRLPDALRHVGTKSIESVLRLHAQHVPSSLSSWEACSSCARSTGGAYLAR